MKKSAPKTKHDGDCTIYFVLANGRPNDGICTCGYGLEQVRQLNGEEVYSRELSVKMAVETEKYLKTNQHLAKFVLAPKRKPRNRKLHTNPAFPKTFKDS